MTYSIWLEPSRKDAEHLNKTIRNLAKKYNSPAFSSHITIYSGVTNLTAAKYALCQSMPAKLRIRTTSIGKSDYLWKTVYINAKNDKNLKRFNSNLKKNLKTKYDFKPHISLIYKKLDPATKKKLIAGLRIKKSYIFDRATIIRSSKNIHKWKKLYTVRLKATGNA